MEFRYINAEAERDRNAVIETLREKEHHYKNILENIPGAVYTCDTRGAITFYNKAASDLWGRAPQIGKDTWCGSWKLYNASGERMMPDSGPMAVTVKEGRAVQGMEIIVERPDGVKRNVMTHPQPLMDGEGNVYGALNMLLDVTEQKLTQSALQLTEEKKNDLFESNSSLRHINQELEQFAYIASHDLQEPVRKIHVYSDRLRERNQGLDEQSKIYIDKIINATHRMQLLIDEVLNYSRLSHHSNQFVNTDLNNIYQDVLEDLELRIEQKNATVECSGLPVAEVIPLQLSQLFYNLIGNSLKYTLEGNHPLIQISARTLNAAEAAAMKLDVKKSFFELTFKDDGIGIKKEFVENIFGVFNRIQSVTHVEGSGIGLAICRKIVHTHQGEIFAESVPGIGTEIHVILPFKQ